jgi:hypothetical protein
MKVKCGGDLNVQGTGILTETFSRYGAFVVNSVLYFCSIVAIG